MSEHSSITSSSASLLLQLTTAIVAAHVKSSAVESEALPALVHAVYDALKSAHQLEHQVTPLKPAAPIKHSVFPDYIICLEDGKKLKMLKRHLMSSYNMTPEQYRARWSLPASYPLVAPNYAARRSSLARDLGLGRKLKIPASPAKTTAADMPDIGKTVPEPKQSRSRKRGARPTL